VKEKEKQTINKEIRLLIEGANCDDSVKEVFYNIIIRIFDEIDSKHR